MVGGWHLGIFQHGLQRQLIIDAFQAACESLGHHYLAMRSSLRAPIAIATARVGHVALVEIDVEQGVDHVGGTLGIVLHEQRERRAVGVPQGIIIVVIGQLAVGRQRRRRHRAAVSGRFLTCLVDGHEKGVVKGGVEHAPLLGRSLVRHAPQQGSPCGAKGVELGVEVVATHIALGLKFRHIRHAHLDQHHRIGIVGGWMGAEQDLGRQAIMDLRRGEGHLAPQAEVNGVGPTVVPSTANGGVAPQLMGVDKVDGGSHKLLRLTLVGDGIHAKE